MPRFLRSLVLAVMAAGAATQAQAPTLDGEHLAGAFVTMTAGARCPSAATIAFSAQGEAAGPIDGRFDARGSLRIDGTGEAGVTLRTFDAELDLNQRQALGTLRWDARDPAWQVSCDPLTLRMDGQLRYALTEPFADAGTVTFAATASRRSVAGPYFGRATLTFHSGALR